MKIDAHQHFWQYSQTEYSWIGDNMEILKKDYLPHHLQGELSTVGFDGSIVVQARQTLEETTWLLKLASDNDFIKGVVGWVDLCSDEIEDQLKKFSVNPKFLGVRHVVHDEPDDQFMARNDFQKGISLLQNYGLTYDLLIFPKHLPLASELVQTFPKQKFVLDHIAKPSIKSQMKAPWSSDIKKIAQFSNVYCKLSGMVTEADWFKWNTDTFGFYLDTVFDAFGTDRLMIGSDWPVCTVAGSYKKVLSIIFDYIRKFDNNTQQRILGKNCVDFYMN